MASTSLHNDVFFDSEEGHEWDVTCAHADVDPLVGSLESTSSGEVAAEVSSWLGRHGWSKRRSSTNGVGNIDGNGKVLWQSKSGRSRSRGFGSGPGEGLRACQPPCGLGLRDAFQLPKENLAGAVRPLWAPVACSVRRMCGGAPPDHHGHLARVQVELLAFTLCSAGCVERGKTNLPFFEAEGFCGWYYGLGERKE